MTEFLNSEVTKVVDGDDLMHYAQIHPDDRYGKRTFCGQDAAEMRNPDLIGEGPPEQKLVVVDAGIRMLGEEAFVKDGEAKYDYEEVKGSEVLLPVEYEFCRPCKDAMEERLQNG